MKKQPRHGTSHGSPVKRALPSANHLDSGPTVGFARARESGGICAANGGYQESLASKQQHNWAEGGGGGGGYPKSTTAWDAQTSWENWKGWDGRGGQRKGGRHSNAGNGLAWRQQQGKPAVNHLKQLTAGRSFRFKDFDLRPTVGTGTFGRVRVVKLRGNVDRTPMALKIMKKSEVIRLKQADHVKAETQILSKIEHPFVVNLLTTFEDERRLFILLEFVNGGELFSYLRRQGSLENEDAQFYSSEITLALEYLHGLKVVYRDLKPENLLIDCEGHIKMTDFGFAKIVEDRTWTLCGTPEYLAPEIIQSKGHRHSVDWWALGILIFEMLAGYPPFFDESPFGIYQKILSGRLEFPEHLERRAVDFISRLLNVDAARRLGTSASLLKGAEDVRRHRFYKGVDWGALVSRRTKPPYIPPVRAPDDTSMFDRYPESTEDSAPSISDKDQEIFVGFALNSR